MTKTLDLSPGSVLEPRLDAARAEVARLINAARAELLRSRTAVTVDQLADARGTSPDTTRRWVSRRRAAGDLVTVTHDGLVLIPTFQLDDAFDHDDDVATLVRRLTRYGMSGWAVWDWAETPNGWLHGDTPADLIRSGRTAEAAAAVDGLTDNA